MEQQEIFVRSTMDGSLQPSLFYRASGNEKRPLLVGLHTWSFDRFNTITNMLPVAEKYNFHFLSPEFRGPNLAKNKNCREACGSELARQDIRDAIDYLISLDIVDTDNIFLLGLSGGGHMALLMAGKCPELFKAIGAYVPITDLQKWTTENPKYTPNVLACCGSEEEMRKRSPVSYIDTIAKANLKLFHGKYDPVVPYTHSVSLYNQIIEKYPDASVYLDIFDGRHEIDMKTAVYWFMSQYEGTEHVTVTG